MWGLGRPISVYYGGEEPVRDIPFAVGMQYLNTTYPNRQKTLCCNFTVNDDNLAYVFVEPDDRAAGSLSALSKQLVIIHAEDGVIADNSVTIPSTVSSKNYMNAPYANNGFVGYWPASGKATNYVLVMKINTTTGELEHVGSSSAYVQVISLGSRKWPGGASGGFTVDGKFYVNYGSQQDNSERPLAICLNNSGSASTYWSSSLIGTSGIGSNSYRTIATALVGDASSGGTNVVMFARYARNTNWTYNDYVLYKTNVSTIYSGAGTQLLTSTPNFNSFDPVATSQPVFIPAYGEQNMRGWIMVMTASGYHKLNLKINSQDIALTDLLTASAGSVSYTSSYHTLHRDRIYQSCGLFYLPVKIGNAWKIWSLDSSLNTTLSDFS